MERVKLSGLIAESKGTVMVELEPLNSAAVPVWSAAPSAPKVTPESDPL
jgi:hypothetical protein